MKAFGDLLAEAYTSCISSVSSCCAPLASRLDDKPRRSESSAFFRGGDFSNRSSAVLSPEDYEKDTHIFRDQPGFTPPPFFGQPVVESQASARRERAPRKSSVSTSRGSFSVRSRFWSNASSTRRPLISHPTNFRHLHSESFQFPHSGPPPAQEPSVPGPSHQARQRPAAFRPLELSIYMRDAKLSPIAPHVPYFESESSITPPRRAYTQDSFDSSSVTLTHQRSHSSMSFHIPRRPVQEAPSLYSHQEDDSPPRIPPRSRLRAYTSPDVDRIVERIASAMLEKERLQAEIDSVIERQSLYANSRPSTAYGIEDIEPMPSIPALPAAAPSFAERLSTDRPLTAPSRPIDIPRRGKSFAEATAAFSTARPLTPPQSGTRINGYPVDVPLAPPLPLVLRPPLRKKKSFSRVSNWLFPGDDSPVQRDISLDPITNHPMPVRDSDGFYQCVQPSSAVRRMSMDSVSSVSTWSTEEDRTVPSSTWSPESTPVTKLDTPTWNIDRTATFGRGAGRFAAGARPPAVGVAY